MLRRAQRGEYLPSGALLVLLWALALSAAGLLAVGWPSGFSSLLPWWCSTCPPAYHEVVYGDSNTTLGRDLVIAPSDATPERIEQVVAAVAATDPSPTLRLNVFTSEAAARQRRALIAAGVYAKDLDQPDPPEWATVYAAWVGIYTRDPANGVHQLSICLNDPDHTHCTVRRY
ncbi:MAG TPA: hypothetical protein VFB73_15745 [Chloroflexota bacterium]|nr:hypothetical protein [Chloroflexota bacterium]